MDLRTGAQRGGNTTVNKGSSVLARPGPPGGLARHGRRQAPGRRHSIYVTVQLPGWAPSLFPACNARSGFHLDSTPYKILSVAASMAKVLQLFVLPVSGSHRAADRDQTFGRLAASSGSAWSELKISSRRRKGNLFPGTKGLPKTFTLGRCGKWYEPTYLPRIWQLDLSLIHI